MLARNVFLARSSRRLLYCWYALSTCSSSVWTFGGRRPISPKVFLSSWGKAEPLLYWALRRSALPWEPPQSDSVVRLVYGTWSSPRTGILLRHLPPEAGGQTSTGPCYSESCCCLANFGAVSLARSVNNDEPGICTEAEKHGRPSVQMIYIGLVFGTMGMKVKYPRTRVIV